MNLFLEENKVPEHCLKLDRWQGPTHINKLKQDEIELSFQGQIVYEVYSVMHTKRACLFRLYRLKNIS